jgi:signal transduction histidine kinase
VENIIGSLQTIALCPFQLEKCGLLELLGLAQIHDFTFISCKDPFSYLNSMVNTDRFELIGKMAASVAHEIRNPMTSVKGFIQLLQGDKDLQKYSSYFMLMIDELERANDIITEYLSIAKPRVRNVENHNLNEILTTMLLLLQADARKEDKDVILVTGDTADILVDPREIRQVILNLVRNGLDSMPSGGVVEIRTSMQNNEIVLEVEDSGHGIPEEIQVHLGKPFVTTKEHGTGLGMYVTYNILKSYQANINIRSSNEGTRFIIRFPSAEGGNSDYICRYKSG